MPRVQSTALALLLALAVSAPASAQTWPQRTVKFLVTLGPGAGVDIGTRLIGDRLSARWGQPVVVENRPGGDGIVAITSFLSARDDHILLASPTSSFTAHPYLHERLPYELADLLPIARVSNTLITISVPASLDVATFADLVAMASPTRSTATLLPGCRQHQRRSPRDSGDPGNGVPAVVAAAQPSSVDGFDL